MQTTQSTSFIRPLTLVAVVMIWSCITANAQNNVGIGTQSPEASALLELRSTSQGLLVPRMTTTERDNIAAPANWLLIFNTTTEEFQYWNGTIWVAFSTSGGGSGWSLTGNTGTSAPTNFLGTIDAQPLHLRAGNNVTAVFETNGALHRGTAGNARGGSAVDLQYGAAGAAVASGGYAVIAGGQANTGSGSYSVIGGGQSNTASNSYANVLGGQSNTASGQFSAVSGGQSNQASNAYSFVGAGQSNTASGSNAGVGVGLSNTAGGSYSFIGGGQSNQASGSNSGVSVGQSNNVSGDYSHIGGGLSNAVTGNYSSIGNGQSNTISGAHSVIPGGRNLTLGATSFGYNASPAALDLSAQSSIAYFGDVDIWLGNNQSTARALRFYEPTGAPATAQYSSFRAQAQNSTIDYILPADPPADINEVLGVNSTSGNITLEWKPGAGSGWNLDGNTIINGEFLGTLNAEDLVFQANSTEYARITTTGSVGIGTSSPHTSALIELSSTDRGFLMPRMLEAEREAIPNPAEGLMVYTTDGGFPGIYYFDGVEWVRVVVPNSLGGVLVKNKTSSESLNNSTTLQNDDHLFVDIPAGQTWIIDGFLRVVTTSNQPDFKFAFTVPTGATMTAGYHVNENATNILAGALTTSGQSVTVNLTSNESSILIYKIMIVNGANAGTFRIQWAQNTSNGTDVTVLSGSFFIASRVF